MPFVRDSSGSSVNFSLLVFDFCERLSAKREVNFSAITLWVFWFECHEHKHTKIF